MNMDCRTLRENLDALEQGTLDAELFARADAHLRQCRACQAFRSDIAMLRRALRTAPLPAVPEDLTERAMLRIAGRRRVPAAAIAASLVAAVALVTGLLMGVPGTPDEPAVATSGQWQNRTVHLSVNAPAPMDAVRFRVELPTAVEVRGHPGRRTLEWTDDLVAGANRLSIPLVLMNGREGELIASLEHEGRVKTMRIPIHQATTETR